MHLCDHHPSPNNFQETDPFIYVITSCLITNLREWSIHLCDHLLSPNNLLEWSIHLSDNLLFYHNLLDSDPFNVSDQLISSDTLHESDLFICDHLLSHNNLQESDPFIWVITSVLLTTFSIMIHVFVWPSPFPQQIPGDWSMYLCDHLLSYNKPPWTWSIHLCDHILSPNNPPRKWSIHLCDHLLSYAPVPLCWICSRTRTNGPFKFIQGVIPGHSSPFLSIRIVFFSFV